MLHFASKSPTRTLILIFVCTILSNTHSLTTIPPSFEDEGEVQTTTENDLLSKIEIKCNREEILVKIPTPHEHFSGMVYPQGLSKNSSCLQEYDDYDMGSYIEYRLPLRSCNTMMVEGVPPGGKAKRETENRLSEEFYNTIVLEPHPKLVTGFGRGYHIRCKYERELFKNQFNVIMKIENKAEESEFETLEEEKQNKVNVKIGDPLWLKIYAQKVELQLVEDNTVPKFIVTNCKVKDGLGWGEEKLIDSYGCPLDTEIMGEFDYNYEKGLAKVQFLAHKFPYSPSVYYSCQVRFCKNGDSFLCEKPDCGQLKNSFRKYHNKRETSNDPEEATIEVFNGILVRETDSNVGRADDENPENNIRIESNRNPDSLCFKKRDFALAIAFSGLFLMIAVLVLLFVLCIRRRNRSHKGSSTSGSSIYSGNTTNTPGGGGYTNSAYTHSS